MNNPPDEFETADAPLYPNKTDIARHLFELFPPAFVRAYPDAWIEIAYANPAIGGPDAAENFSVFDLQAAAEFAEKKNKDGFNIYVGAALRHGERCGRASGLNVLTASHSWAEFDKQGDDARIQAILKEKNLLAAMTVVTGRTPHLRAHLYFRLAGNFTPDELRTVNAAMKTLLGSDAVQNPDRVMRLAGTISYPPPQKVERGYVAELVTLHLRMEAPAYVIEQLVGAAPRQKGYGETPETPAPTSESFFKEVNQLALLRLTTWVKPLFGEKVKFYRNTGAWRITSKALGRNLEEDLSISQRGVWDYGTEKASSPIDLVMEYGPRKSSFIETTSPDAALWLCERMGIVPEALGWGNRERRSADDAGYEGGYDFNNTSAGQGGTSSADGDEGADQGQAGHGPQGDQGAPGKDQGRQQAQPPIELLWHGQEQATAKRPWLVKDLIPETGKGLAAGQWGTAKTFGVIDLAGSIMTATSFAGRTVVRQGGVLFVAAEGSSEIAVRLQGIVDYKLRPNACASGAAGQPVSVNLEKLPFAWIEEGTSLKDGFDRLVSAALTAAAHIRDQFDLPLSLVIIDTLNAAAYFKDGNDAAEGQLIMNRLEELSRRTGAFVLAVDHFGKAVETGTRGTSAKEAASDAVLAFLADRDTAGNVKNLRMAVRKLRGGTTGAETPFELSVVDIGDGESTCIIEWRTGESVKPANQQKDKWTRSLRVFRAAMATALAEHGAEHTPFGSVGPKVRAVPAQMVRQEFKNRYPGEQAAKVKAFTRSLKDALSRGLIVSWEVGGIDQLWFVQAEDGTDIHIDKPDTP
jgi:hypothetical protein